MWQVTILSLSLTCITLSSVFGRPNNDMSSDVKITLTLQTSDRNDNDKQAMGFDINSDLAAEETKDKKQPTESSDEEDPAQIKSHTISRAGTSKVMAFGNRWDKENRCFMCCGNCPPQCGIYCGLCCIF